MLSAAAIGLMLFAPETPAGRALRRLFVETPARALNRLRSTHWILGLAIVLIALAAASLSRELFVLFAQGTPELVAWIAAFDIATYVDVIAAAVLVAAAVRLRTALAFGRHILARLRQVRRSTAGRRRVRGPRRRKGPPADSEGGAESWPAGLAWA